MDKLEVVLVPIVHREEPPLKVKKRGKKKITIYRVEWIVRQYNNGKVLAADLATKKDARAAARLLGYTVIDPYQEAQTDAPIAAEMIKREKYT